MRIAAKVRLEKEAHPERFCRDARCLWRVVTRLGPNPCPRHRYTTVTIDPLNPQAGTGIVTP